MKVDRLVSQELAEVIGLSLERIPERIRPMLEPVRFVCTDPISIGLHAYETTTFNTSYRSTPHFCEPHHLTGPDKAPVSSCSRKALKYKIAKLEPGQDDALILLVPAGTPAFDVQRLSAQLATAAPGILTLIVEETYTPVVARALSPAQLEILR